MLEYNGKEFRNLEDQVGYLTAAFNSGKLIDELGIKVLGIFPDLTTAKETIRPPYEYGDAFCIGTEAPYNLYIYTRDIEDFFDFGKFNQRGPSGPTGPAPSITINAEATNTTGTPEAIVTKTGTDEAPIFNFTFKNIKGERGQTGMQGVQGPRGFTGATGPIGPRGYTGPKGDVGPAFKLLGDLTSTSQLPSPTAALQAQGAAYTIPNAQGVKHIWVIQGTDNLLWTDIGESGVQGPKGDPGIGINSLRTVKDIGVPSVTYNTNGITINNTVRYTYGDGEQVDTFTQKKIPLIAGEGISMDANAGNDKTIIKSLSKNIENGEGTGSLVQKRLKTDGITWATPEAYQGASTALGGGTQAGRTEEEFNAYFWDSVNNVPLHDGQGKDSNGNILDNYGLTYAQSYSFSLATGDYTKALGRSSHSEGNDTQAIGIHSHAEGLSTKAEGFAAHTEGTYTEAYYKGSHAEGDHTKTDREYQHVGGTYNFCKNYALFIVGNGTSEIARRNAFEVLEDGRAKVQSGPTENDDVVRKLELDNYKIEFDNYWNEFNLENGTGLDSIVLKYSGTVDETHFASSTTGERDVCLGEANKSSGKRNIIVGKLNENAGSNNIIGGLFNVCKSNHCLLSGEGINIGEGRRHKSGIGRYNVDKPNTLFEVGNGDNTAHRSNAFEVYADGTIGVPNFDSNGNRIGMVTLKVVNGELKITTYIS